MLKGWRICHARRWAISSLMVQCDGASGVLTCSSLMPSPKVGLGGKFELFSRETFLLCNNVLLSVATGILFGIAPAMRTARLELHESLKDSSRGAAGAGAVWGRGRNARALLVVAELALSVVLLMLGGCLAATALNEPQAAATRGDAPAGALAGRDLGESPGGDDEPHLWCG